MKSNLPRFVFLLLLLVGGERMRAQCLVSFTWTQTQNNEITFTNTSTNMPSSPPYVWYFGDNLSDTSVNPVHFYNVPGTYNVALSVNDSLNGCSTVYWDTITVTGTLNCTLTSHMWGSIVSCASCTDGQAYVTPTGGTPPYTYTWSNASTGSYITNLPTGTYSVCVTDAAGCQVCDSLVLPVSTCIAGFTWTQPSSNNIQFTNTSTQQTLPNVTYSWNFGDNQSDNQNSPTHQYNVPGLYSVCLLMQDSAQGCWSTFCDSITVTGTIICNLSDSLVSGYASCANCFDGTAYLNVFGGTPPYTYAWSSGETGMYANALGAGTQWVTITDVNNCQLTDSFNILVSNCQAAFSAAQTTPNSVTVTSTSLNLPPNPIYQWDIDGGFMYSYGSPATLTFNGPGPHSIHLLLSDTLNGCASNYTDTMNVWGSTTPGCISYFSLVPDTSNPHLITAYNSSAGTGPVSYDWDWGDGAHDYTYLPTHTYATSGIYQICLYISDSSGCFSTFCNSLLVARMSSQTASTLTTVTVVQGPPIITGMVSSQQNGLWNFYPNPAGDVIRFEGVENGSSCTVTDVSGRVVLSEKRMHPTLDTHALAKGVYLITLTDAQGARSSKRLVKE